LHYVEHDVVGLLAGLGWGVGGSGDSHQVFSLLLRLWGTRLRRKTGWLSLSSLSSAWISQIGHDGFLGL
jgi:hypothetical protein